MGVVVNLFSDLPYGDGDALLEFLAAHHQAHADLNAWLARSGVGLATPDLSRAPDAQWFADHALLHSALNHALQTPGAPGLFAGWKDADAFYAWHRTNADDHASFQQKTGVG